MTDGTAEGPADGPLQVVATAGHVDHGKSSLILRLTGMDPDRFEEEKRRGLTIDLGFAWCTLPSGRRIGFVDVPGHERFVRNMLAGVGPVRLILFVVAADEGWKPQSEEHLGIVDVLGAHGGVVALTKTDLVDPDTVTRREGEVRDRLTGTVLALAPIVRCSAETGQGLDELLAALDRMVAAAPPPADVGRPRLFVDRAFTIKGAGTVVTGTLTGGALSVGDEVRIDPDGTMARIRSLQTHKRSVETARPTSRVAVNLAGVATHDVARGDALVGPGQARPTSILEVEVRPLRGLSRPGARGAYKVHLGSAERDARFQPYEGVRFARLTLSRPVVAEAGDRFVLRDAGPRRTVGGGTVLDADPPARPGPDPGGRLARRAGASGDELARVVVEERGAIRAADLARVAPGKAAGAVPAGEWVLSGEAFDRLAQAARSILDQHHRAHPLRAGMEAPDLRRALIAAAGDGLVGPLEQGLGDEVLAALERGGLIERAGSSVRLATHRVSLGARETDARDLVARVAAAEPTPPTARGLAEAGVDPDLVEACVAAGRLVRISTDIVVTPAFARRAEDVARTEAGKPEGLTVSRFRELLGTTRKYALPLLADLDARGITRRQGDVRRPGPNA